jgi:hypothetical protein
MVAHAQPAGPGAWRALRGDRSGAWHVLDALSAGPGAWRALRGERRGHVELVFAEGAYLAFGDDRVLLSAPGRPFGPLSLAVAGLSGLELAPGMAARVAGGELTVGAARIGLGPARLRLAIALGRSGDPRTALGPVVEALPRASAAVQPGLAALWAGRPDATDLLGGRGGGLTPEGDDVLAGHAAWRHGAGAPVRPSAALAGRTSALSLAYLRCAERGELPDACAGLLRAVRAGDAVEAARLVPAQRGWGDSSGIAIAWGILAGVVSTSVNGRPRW